MEPDFNGEDQYYYIILYNTICNDEKLFIKYQRNCLNKFKYENNSELFINKKDKIYKILKS